MKTIDTLVSDVHDLLEGKGGWHVGHSTTFGMSVANVMSQRLKPSTYSGGTIRMSNMGQPCGRKLWYHVNGSPGTPLPSSVRMKFLYGDIIEETVLALVEAAGHRVEGQQDTMEVEGIIGHRDCVIDGMLVDVKSASTFGYKKFRDGGLKEDDPFGYIAQLTGYLLASQDDPLVTNKKEAAFLVMDKQHGHLTLDVYNLEEEMKALKTMVRARKKMVAEPAPPPRPYRDKPQSKTSPNRMLDIQCSYCDHKHTCWPGLRTFIYSYGPQYLTKVVKEPKVMEVK